jgi:hypothetical protein
MKTVFKPLADMDFANVLMEAYADTQTGTSLINKYRQHLLTNESTCALVNGFLSEAKNCMYDSGIVSVVNDLTDVIAENKISWQLATACEAINANHSSYNYLNRNAASTVEKLLEQNEENVVKYIKAGALKHVMFCEAIRNIVNGVFTDCQTVITEEYTATKPVSYVEENEGKKYFEVLGNIFSMEGTTIKEASASEVSGDFLVISRLLESNAAHFDANSETLTVDTPLATYEVFVENECTKCKRTPKKKCVDCDPEDKAHKDVKDLKTESITFENEFALREHNRMVVGATNYTQRNQVAELLEGIARAFEKFENFMLLDNTQIIESKNDKFVIIENAENAFAYLISSNHNTGWKLNTTIVEAINFIKKHTNLNIAKDYKSNIDEQIKKTEEDKAKQIAEDIKKGELTARKQKIEMLTEKFKDDPATLAVLAKVAQALNEDDTQD